MIRGHNLQLTTYCINTLLKVVRLVDEMSTTIFTMITEQYIILLLTHMQVTW